MTKCSLRQRRKVKPQESRCPECKHIVNTKSELIFISCSSCGQKFNREKNLVKNKSKIKTKDLNTTSTSTFYERNNKYKNA